MAPTIRRSAYPLDDSRIVTIIVTNGRLPESGLEAMPTSRRFAVAVHILTLMAWAEGEPLKSDIVADSINTNPVVIRRILCALARAGLVTSQTGAAGGSRLSRKPISISLLDVYRAVEDGDAFLLHRRPNPHCPIGMSIEIVLEDVLSDVNSAMERALSRINVADVLCRIESCKKGGRRAARQRSQRRSHQLLVKRVSKGGKGNVRRS